jgi:hypothetical protein
MGKVIVYLRARDERELKAIGVDPGDWVRDLVRRALEERSLAAREPRPKEEK